MFAAYLAFIGIATMPVDTARSLLLPPSTGKYTSWSVEELHAVSAVYQGEGKLDARIVILEDLAPKPVVYTDFIIENLSSGTRTTTRTDLEGHMQVTLSAGRYRISTVKPVEYKNKLFTWNRTVDIAESEVYSLVLTQDDADVTTSNANIQSTSETRIFYSAKDSVYTIKTDLAHGSGFLVDQKGLIVTNYHVIQGSDNISVVVAPNKKYPAVFVSADVEADVAVIAVSPDVVQGHKPLDLLGDKEAHPLEGESIVAIGSPLNQERIISKGIISALRDGAILSDVSISHGSSGGPVLNSTGKVVGIATFRDSDEGNSAGVSGIVSIDEARRAIRAGLEQWPTVKLPADTLLPVVPAFKIPNSMLDSISSTLWPEIQVINEPRNFRMVFDTPFSRRAELLKQIGAAQSKIDRRYAKDRPARSPTVTGDHPSGFLWSQHVLDDLDPVVQITIAPAMKETSASLWRRVVGALVGQKLKQEFELRDDFRLMKAFRDGNEYLPIDSGRTLLTRVDSNAKAEISDVAFYGNYIYDPELFAPGADVRFYVWKNNRKDPETVVLDKSLQRYIWQQFEPWRKLFP